MVSKGVLRCGQKVWRRSQDKQIAPFGIEADGQQTIIGGQKV
jgi:hypothetical protein